MKGGLNVANVDIGFTSPVEKIMGSLMMKSFTARVVSRTNLIKSDEL